MISTCFPENDVRFKKNRRRIMSRITPVAIAMRKAYTIREAFSSMKEMMVAGAACSTSMTRSVMDRSSTTTGTAFDHHIFFAEKPRRTRCGVGGPATEVLPCGWFHFRL